LTEDEEDAGASGTTRLTGMPSSLVMLNMLNEFLGDPRNKCSYE
jgi:hypothetical protein